MKVSSVLARYGTAPHRPSIGYIASLLHNGRFPHGCQAPFLQGAFQPTPVAALFCALGDGGRIYQPMLKTIRLSTSGVLAFKPQTAPQANPNRSCRKTQPVIPSAYRPCR